MHLLLDEHFSEQDAAQIRDHHPAIDVVSLHVWEGGTYRALSDSDLLAVARQQGRTLVTRDVRTIAPLLVMLAQTSVSHSGVIFVDHRTIPEGNTGELMRAIADLWEEESENGWTDRVMYLRPGSARR